MLRSLHRNNEQRKAPGPAVPLRQSVVDPSLPWQSPLQRPGQTVQVCYPLGQTVQVCFQLGQTV